MRKSTLIMTCVMLAAFFGYAGFGDGGCASDNSAQESPDALMVLTGRVGRDNVPKWFFVNKTHAVVSTTNGYIQYWRFRFQNNNQYLCVYVSEVIQNNDSGFAQTCSSGNSPKVVLTPGEQNSLDHIMTKGLK